MTAPVLWTVEDGLASIILNRPERLNALDADAARAWTAAVLDSIARDDVRAILLGGAGQAFCAGGDVLAMGGQASAEHVAGLARILNEGITGLVTSAVPVVAAAQGSTVGGGLGLLLCSDYAIVGADSVLGSRYAQVGLTPDLSVTAQLTRAVGERRALQLLLSDRMLTAHEALEWGLAAEVVAGEDAAATAQGVRDRAVAVARSWIEGPSSAYGQAKRLVRAAAGRPLDQQLEDEARTIGAAVETADAQARLAAFARRASAG